MPIRGEEEGEDVGMGAAGVEGCVSITSDGGGVKIAWHTSHLHAHHWRPATYRLLHRKREKLQTQNGDGKTMAGQGYMTKTKVWLLFEGLRGRRQRAHSNRTTLNRPITKDKHSNTNDTQTVKQVTQYHLASV